MVAKGSLKICCREISTTFLQDETPKWKGQEWNSNIVGHEGIAQLAVKKINFKKNHDLAGFVIGLYPIKRKLITLLQLS